MLLPDGLELKGEAEPEADSISFVYGPKTSDLPDSASILQVLLGPVSESEDENHQHAFVASVIIQKPSFRGLHDRFSQDVVHGEPQCVQSFDRNFIMNSLDLLSGALAGSPQAQAGDALLETMVEDSNLIFEKSSS